MDFSPVKRTPLVVQIIRLVPASEGLAVDLAWSPLLREEGFKRAVESKEDEPAFVRHGLYPVYLA